MSHTIYQGEQITLAISARQCDRCARRGQCFYVCVPLPLNRPPPELSLCLASCWPQFLAALERRSELES